MRFLATKTPGQQSFRVTATVRVSRARASANIWTAKGYPGGSGRYRVDLE